MRRLGERNEETGREMRPPRRGRPAFASLSSPPHLEVGDGGVAVVLAHAAVQRCRRQLLLEQLTKQVVARFLRQGEASRKSTEKQRRAMSVETKHATRRYRSRVGWMRWRAGIKIARSHKARAECSPYTYALVRRAHAPHPTPCSRGHGRTSLLSMHAADDFALDTQATR
eukprot:6180441-Pleurochrysis_carterae.AAC.1